LFRKIGHHLLELLGGLDRLPLYHRRIPEDEALIGPVRKTHEDQSFCSPIIEPLAGLFECFAIIYSRKDNRRPVHLDLAAESLEYLQRDIGGWIVHVPLPF